MHSDTRVSHELHGRLSAAARDMLGQGLTSRWLTRDMTISLVTSRLDWINGIEWHSGRLSKWRLPYRLCSNNMWTQDWNGNGTRKPHTIEGSPRDQMVESGVDCRLNSDVLVVFASRNQTSSGEREVRFPLSVISRHNSAEVSGSKGAGTPLRGKAPRNVQ